MNALRNLGFGIGLFMLLFVGMSSFGSKRMSDKERGEMLYQRHCQSCHGATAKGDGPSSKDLMASTPDLTTLVQEERLDELASLLMQGKGSMPSFEASFDKHDAKRVLQHVIRLSEANSNAEEKTE